MRRLMLVAMLAVVSGCASLLDPYIPLESMVYQAPPYEPGASKLEHAGNKVREAANLAVVAPVSITLSTVSAPFVLGAGFLCFCTDIDGETLRKLGIDCSSPL